MSKSGTETYPWFDAPRKWSLTVRGPDNLLSNKELVAGDQIKLTIEVPREEAVEWKQIREAVLGACKDIGLSVYGAKMEIKTAKNRKRVRVGIAQGTNHARTLEQFCTAENVSSQIREVGVKLLGE